jgi:hypothetical protein
MEVIGLSGKAGQGKDAIFESILRPRGWRRWTFAHPIKAAGVGFGFDMEDVTTRKPRHVREWLQRYGTEEHRDKYNEDFWIKEAEYWLHVLSRDIGTEKIVFTDVRFPNEARWIKSKGGVLVRVTGRSYPLEGTPAASHPSEVALDDWKRWDLVLENKEGTPLSALAAEMTAANIL